MKNSIITIVLLLFTQTLFSSTAFSGIIDTSFSPLALRYQAMGEAGIAIPNRDEVFFINAAGLGDDESFYLKLPNISLSLYQAKDILSSPMNDILQGDIDAILDLAGLLNGTFPLVVAEESISASFKHFGLSFDMKQVISSTGQSFSSGFIPALFGSLSLGYGYEWNIDENCSLSLGFMEHISAVWYSTPISAESVVNLLKGDSSALQYIYSSLKFSTDMGAIIKVPYGFSFAFVANNISNGITLINKTSGETERFYHPSTISIGSAWSHRFNRAVKFSFAYDFVNIIEFFTSPSLANFLYKSNLGAELVLYDFISLYGGINGGYLSYGAELNLWFINLGILYRYQEFGKEVGLNPKDQLEIRLGFIF